VQRNSRSMVAGAACLCLCAHPAQRAGTRQRGRPRRENTTKAKTHIFLKRSKSTDDNHKYKFGVCVSGCVCMLLPSLPTTKASTDMDVRLHYHCRTGARAFFGDFTWNERCSSALRNPECAGDFGFSTYKPRGIL
jgi:hypothetical protein